MMNSKVVFVFAWVAAALLNAGAAGAASHTWDVNEVFSNSDGTVQFVELMETDGLANETAVSQRTFTSNANSFPLGFIQVAPPTSNKFYLIATAAFAALPGAPTPDSIIPAGMVPFFFQTTGDTITYLPWDSLTFVSGDMPINGRHSLNKDFSVGLNSPTNYAGVTGSVDASLAIATPAVSTTGLMLVAASLLAAGYFGVVRRRMARAS